MPCVYRLRHAARLFPCFGHSEVPTTARGPRSMTHRHEGCQRLSRCTSASRFDSFSASSIFFFKGERWDSNPHRPGSQPGVLTIGPRSPCTDFVDGDRQTPASPSTISIDAEGGFEPPPDGFRGRCPAVRPLCNGPTVTCRDFPANCRTGACACGALLVEGLVPPLEDSPSSDTSSCRAL